MNKPALNPILIIEDDEDDVLLLNQCAEALNLDRTLIYFKDGPSFLRYLKDSGVVPFLTICDVNLPQISGFEIREQLNQDPHLKYKSVPFIFWSTDSSEKQIQYAYDLPAQGFFFKPTAFGDLMETFDMILKYWQKSQHPKQVS